MWADKLKYPLHDILWEVGGPVDAVAVVALEGVDVVRVYTPSRGHGEEGADAFRGFVLLGGEDLSEETHGGRLKLLTRGLISILGVRVPFRCRKRVVELTWGWSRGEAQLSSRGCWE